MNALVNGALIVLLLLAGVYLSMRCIAALHRIVDLGYALRREKWRIARGLAGSGGATLILFLILPAPWDAVFLISLLGYALLYVVLWSVIGLLLSLRRTSTAASTLDDGSHAHAARGTDGDQPPA